MTGTNITTVITPTMTQLLDELKEQLTLVIQHEYKSSELLVKIYEQGKADGLPNDKIRELVISVLRDVKRLGDRQIRRLLPQELKRKYSSTQEVSQEEPEKFTDSDMMSELPNTFSQTFASLNISINPEYEKINGSHNWFRNTRTSNIYDKELDSLKNHIQSIGPQTIIINEYGTIIDGHKTFRICNELGITPRYEVREFEDEYAEQEFIIWNHMHPGLIEFRRYQLYFKFEKLVKNALLERHPRYLDEYLSIGTWFKNILIAAETRLIKKDVLCFLCEIDGKVDPFLDLKGKVKEKNDQHSKHLLEHIESSGWKKYLPHLVKHERYLDPITHQWKFKDAVEEYLEEEQDDDQEEEE